MKLIFAVLMLLAWTTPVLATPSFEEAMAMFEDKDFKAAIETDPKHPRRIITLRGAGYIFARNQDEQGQ